MSTRTRSTPSGLRILASFGVAVGAVALLAWLPGHSGSSWTLVGQVVADVPAALLAALCALWFAGLVANSLALAACLPGLPMRRALTLSLTGSAVANVLPLGGAAGVGVNYAVVRSWGYNSSDFATYTVVTNLVDVATKVVVLAVAGAVVLAAGPGALPGPLGPAALGVAVALLLGAASLLCPPVGTAVGRQVDAIAARVGRLVRRPLQPRLEARLPLLAASSVEVLRRAWVRVLAGSTAYALLQAALLAACFRVCGLPASVPLVAGAFATDRLLTLLPLTPGGVGLVEAVLCGTVLAWGAPAGPAVASVLLYRALTYAAEVPVGGAVLLGWLIARASRSRLLDARRESAPGAVP